ncbi:MCE family protein [Fulvivirga sp. RKSG066]|uniref:MlaD family protein n=1 Tax=Fulvivirga aurantia TaxID=2529383 RepID=UPI0012BB931E|nr:MlaD family protein [Fulvivirga aurantia]MTI22253.1 MCE family protein [Fulvivirga aurantia]
MKNIIALTLIGFCLASCHNSDTYYLALDDADGLNTMAPVYVNGLSVGNATELELSDKYKVVFTLEVKPNFEIPKDSEVYFESDFLGNKSIVINPGKSSNNYSPHDTLATGLRRPLKTQSHGLKKLVDSFLNSMSNNADSINQIKQDSLLIELRRLNNNLEKLGNSY